MSGDKILAEVRERKLMRRAEKLQERMGEAILTLDDYVQDTHGSNNWVRELRFKVRYEEQGDILIVVKREGEAGQQVAFHSADTLGEAVISLANRMRNGSLKWREDTPYEG